jgi:hypothetical protein
MKTLVEDHRGGVAQHGLCFQGPDGRPQLVSAEALARVFGAAGSSVKLLVLNACYSEKQAQALLAHVGYVVGMNGGRTEVRPVDIRVAPDVMRRGRE